MNVYQIVVLTLLISIVGGAGYFATTSGTTKTAYTLLAGSPAQQPSSMDGAEQNMASSSEQGFFDGLRSMFFSDKKGHSQVNSLVAQLIQGTYSCTKSETVDSCTADMNLVLEGNGTAILVSSYEGGAEVQREEGTWEVNDVGQIMVVLDHNQSSNYRIPHTLMFNREEDGSTLTAAQYNQEHYPGILTGLFVRQ